MKLRLATPEDHPWITARYEQAGFLRSNFQKDTIAIAEISGRKAGAGRLVPVDDDTYELGAIFVEEVFKGQGVAKEIIDYLMKKAEGKTVYTIPLKHLVELYQSIGFENATETESPADIVDKFKWFKQRNDDGVGLLKKRT